MIKNLTLKDFTIYPEYIKYEDIEKMLGKRRYKKFLNFMRGQTVADDRGCYPCDLLNFLTNSNDWD